MKTIGTLTIFWIVVLVLVIKFTTSQDTVFQPAQEKAPRVEQSDIQKYTNRYTRSQDGHFYIPVQFDKNTTIEFLLDTGATHTIFSLQDARKIGVRPELLRYNKKYTTGSGVIICAEINISHMYMGNFTLENVKASVTDLENSQSVIGMDLIAKFFMEVNQDVATLSVYK